MNEHFTEHQAEQDIFAHIKSGKIKMRPRWYFILETVLVIVAGTVLFVSIIFLAIFIVFIQHETGAGLAVSYGLTGWYIFLRELPWTLIFTAVVFILLLAILAKRRYAFVYQRPLIYALIGIVVLVVLGSVAVTETPIYPVVFNPAPRSQGFFINGIYQYETEPINAVHRGEITLIANNGFLLQNYSGETSTVLFGLGTPFTAQDFRAGEQVVVFGERTATGVIEAFGIQQF